jgi:hypothetical protein
VTFQQPEDLFAIDFCPAYAETRFVMERSILFTHSILSGLISSAFHCASFLTFLATPGIASL